MKNATAVEARIRKGRRNMKRRRISRDRIVEGLIDFLPEPNPVRSWRQKLRDEADRQDDFDYQYEYLQPMLEDDEYWDKYSEMERDAEDERYQLQMELNDYCGNPNCDICCY